MGATNSNTGKNTKFYSLKAKADETNTPYFGLIEKVNDKWQITSRFDTMTGLLTSAEIKEKEYNGSKFNIFVLIIEDEAERIQIELTHNGLTYSIINSLASNCNKMDTYTIQVYKKQSTDKKYWNANCSIYLNGNKEDKVKWKVDPTTAPKKVPVMVDGKPFMMNGQPVKDDSALRAFYEDMFRSDIISRLSPNVKTTETGQNTASSDTVTDVTPIVDAENDMPF
jgi:hypothetical protein